MATPKTQPTDASVPDFLAAVPDPRRREEGLRMDLIVREVTGVEPVMWGPTMVGYGSFRVPSGASWPRVAFSPRKGALTLYGLKDRPEAAEHLAGLGPFTEGAGCLYVKRLDALDEIVLRRLVTIAWERPEG